MHFSPAPCYLVHLGVPPELWSESPRLTNYECPAEWLLMCTICFNSQELCILLTQYIYVACDSPNTQRIIYTPLMGLSKRGREWARNLRSVARGLSK